MATARVGQRLLSQHSSGRLSTVSRAGPYSTHKLLQLDDYLQRRAYWRASLVIIAIPLPGLLTASILSFLPLQPLRHGPTPAFHCHLFVSMLVITYGMLMTTTVVTRIPSAVYSSREVAAVSLLTSVIHVAVTSLVWRLWRFPVPFHWIVGIAHWLFHSALAHLLVLRSKCWRPEMLRAVKLHGLGLSVQLLQVVLYPATSVLFDHVSPSYQVVITILFPLVKVVMKRALEFTTTGLPDQHSVVVVAAVEICASLYQSIIMQSVPSEAAVLVIMTIDVLQGFASLKFMMDQPSTVPRNRLLHEAIATVRHRQQHQKHQRSPVSRSIDRLPSPHAIAPAPQPVPTRTRKHVFSHRTAVAAAAGAQGRASGRDHRAR